MSETKEMGGSPIATREVSNGSGEKKSKKKGCMRHCKKFWWVYLIVFILAAVLIICLIIFVAVPKIAQGKINDAKLELTNVEILDTTSDTYEMTIDSIIRSDGKVHAKISPFEGVMYLEDKPGHTPFATLDFPETSSDKYQEVNVTQDVKISDMDAFTDFNIWFHNNDTLKVTVEGKTKVQPKGLSRKYDVDFKKTVEIKGLNVFEGTKVTEGEIKRLDKNETGPNFVGKTDIPNQSVFTLDIGNITFNNYIEGEHVGYLYIDNFILKPGSNVVDITAEINQAKVLEYLTSDKYCKDGIIPMELLGENITNHGQDISYFAAALASKKQIVEMDIGKFIKESPDYGLDLLC